MKAPVRKATVSPASAEEKNASLKVNGGMGEVKIHENVISAIVRRATLAVDGVSRLAGNTLVDTIGEIVGSRRMQDRAIGVVLAGDNRAALTIKVIFRHDVRIPDVSTAIQAKVIEAVESVTGMKVTAVDVLVQDIEAAPEEGEDIEAEEMTIVRDEDL